MNITSNISEVILNLTHEVNELANPERVIRSVAQSMVSVVKERIHDQGKDSANGNIGEYSNSYLKLRIKDNRTNDKKVILSLTRQMENDFSIVAIPDGYGLGFKNDENFRKAQYAEKNYNKKIYDLTPQENELVIKVAEFESNRLLND